MISALDRAGLDQRAQHEVGGGGIAAGPGDALRPADLGAEKFGQPEAKLRHVGPRMGLAIPARIVIGAVEAEVGAEVDDGTPGPSRSSASRCVSPCGRAAKIRSLPASSPDPTPRSPVGIGQRQVRMECGNLLSRCDAPNAMATSMPGWTAIERINSPPT